MPYNEPTFGESGEVYTDNVRNSLAHVKSAAEAAQATADNAVASIVTTSQTADEAKEIAQSAADFVSTPTDGRVASLVEDSTSGTRVALAAAYGTVLPPSDGTDDTATIQAVLDAAGRIRGRWGETYLISAPLVIRSNTVLDMTGCTVRLIANSRTAMLTNAAFQDTARWAFGTMTNGSTTYTQTRYGASFTAADVGKPIRVWRAGGVVDEALDTTIAAYVDANTVTLADPATADVTDAYAAIGPRDENIEVFGGVWDRGSNAAAPDDWRVHNLIFQRVDHVKVHDLQVTSTDSKYAVFFGDVTDYHATRLHFEVNSDGVHVDGPAFDGTIDTITGTTGDDSVAFTAMHGTWNYAFSLGPWRDAHVSHVTCRSSDTTSEVKFRSDGYAGKCWASASDCDAKSINLDGGFHAGGDMDVALDNCTGRIVAGETYSATVPSTIGSLRVTNHRYTNTMADRYLLTVTGALTVDHLVMQGITSRTGTGLSPSGILKVYSTGAIEQADIDGFSQVGGDNSAVVSYAHTDARIGVLNLSNGVFRTDTNTGAAILCPAVSGEPSADQINMSNVVVAAHKVAVVHTPVEVNLANVTGSTYLLQTGTPVVTLRGNGYAPSGNQEQVAGKLLRPPGTILARTEYNPATMASYATTSTTPVALSASNLSVTFSAPASGAVDVELDACARGQGGGQYAQWSLMEGAAVVAGSTASVVQGGGVINRANYRRRITGLTPGTSYTWSWALSATAGTTTAQTYVGGDPGYAEMRVIAA